MRLKQTGGVEGAIQKIPDLQVQLENSRSGLTGTERRNALLQWLDDQAGPALEFLFEDASDIIEDVDASYDRLAGSHLDGSDLYILATRQNNRWRERIQRVEAELQRQKQLADRRGTPVILDTSVLMEAEPLGTIDWPSPAPVRLIVPILVVEELDDLLHDRDAARRKKARDARRVLMKALVNEPKWAVRRMAPFPAASVASRCSRPRRRSSRTRRPLRAAEECGGTQTRNI